MNLQRIEFLVDSLFVFVLTMTFHDFMYYDWSESVVTAIGLLIVATFFLWKK